MSAGLISATLCGLVAVVFSAVCFHALCPLVVCLPLCTQLFLYLKSFLTVLATLHEPYAKADRDALQSVLKRAAADFTDAVFEQSKRSKTGLINYEEFGRWYNDGGHLVVPWLELLDLKKWPLAPSALKAAAQAQQQQDEDDEVAEDNEYEYLSSGAEEDGSAPAPRQSAAQRRDVDADEYDDEDEDAQSTDSEVVFEFPLVPEQSVVRLTTSDVRHLKFLVTGTDFPEMSPADIIAEVKRLSRHNVLQKDGFQDFVAENVVNAATSDKQSTYLWLALTNIYNSFDREADGCVDTSEFAAAFTLLADGSKSDKLVEAFGLFDGNGVGRLSKLALWKFIRALLTMLGAIVSISHDLTDNDLSVSAVDRGAIEITSVRAVVPALLRCCCWAGLFMGLCDHCRRCSVKRTWRNLTPSAMRSSANGTTTAATRSSRGWSCWT